MDDPISVIRRNFLQIVIVSLFFFVVATLISFVMYATPHGSMLGFPFWFARWGVFPYLEIFEDIYEFSIYRLGLNISIWFFASISLFVLHDRFRDYV